MENQLIMKVSYLRKIKIIKVRMIAIIKTTLQTILDSKIYQN